MSPILCAFVASILQAFNTVILRHTMRDDGDVWATAMLFYGMASVILLCFFPLPDLSSLSWGTIALLTIGGSCWTVVTFLDFKAYQYLEASACEVIGTLSIILLCLSGCLLYSETITLLQAVGIATIISTILYTARVKAMPFNRGTLFKIGSVLGVTIVYSIDKHLVTQVPKEAMLYFGYCTPGIIMLLFRWRSVPKMSAALRRSNFALLLVPFSSIIRFQLVIFALSAGSLGITYTIIKAGILFVLLFEILLLRMREGLARKTLACLGCLTGAVILGI